MTPNASSAAGSGQGYPEALSAVQPTERLAMKPVVLAPTSIDEAARTFEACILSGTPVQRSAYDGEYSLVIDPNGVDLTRAQNGVVPLLDSHSSFEVRNVLGCLEFAWVRDGKLYARFRFSDRPEIEGQWSDVRRGVLRGVSVGIVILAYTDERDKDGRLTRTVTAFSLLEVSLVAVPADPAAATLSYNSQTLETRMNEKQTTQAAAVAPAINPDAAKIRDLAQKLKMSGLGEDLIARGCGINEAREALINRVADIHDQIETRSASSVATVTRDARQGMVESMAEALACRYTGQKPSDQARQYMGARIADLARECCIANGVRVAAWEPSEVIKLSMHNTADFPNLLGSTGARMLKAAYQAAEPQIKRIARKSTAVDFRTKYVLGFSEMPQLLLNNEGAQIVPGPVTESKESYSLATWARRLQFTRQALINDDLGAFNDIARAFGQSAVTMEATQLANLLYGAAGVGPTMVQDSKAMFHTDHGNLGAGIIGEVGLNAARLAMRTQKGLDGITIIEVAPRYLVVPAALETTAQKMLASIQPTAASSVNPFSGTLELVVVPQLDAMSTSNWWMFGDPTISPSIEYAYLSGAEGIQVDSQAGWDILGMDFRAYIDFGCGGVDYRGAYKSSGV